MTKGPLGGVCSGVALTMNWEELTDAFESVVHRDFPNPNRMDCPGRDSLALLASYSASAECVQILAHIRRCSPCFDELKRLKTNTKG